jgi:hypothetical protein
MLAGGRQACQRRSLAEADHSANIRGIRVIRGHLVLLNSCLFVFIRGQPTTRDCKTPIEAALQIEPNQGTGLLFSFEAL